MQALKKRFLSIFIAASLGFSGCAMLPMSIGSRSGAAHSPQFSSTGGIFNLFGRVFNVALFLGVVGIAAVLIKKVVEDKDGGQDSTDEGSTSGRSHRSSGGGASHSRSKKRKSRKRRSDDCSDSSDSDSDDKETRKAKFRSLGIADAVIPFVRDAHAKTVTALAVKPERRERGSLVLQLGSVETGAPAGVLEEGSGESEDWADADVVQDVIYIQLRTANQFDRTITEPVRAYQKKLKQRLLRAKRVRAESDLSGEDQEQLEGFAPSATCASQAVKNAYCMVKFLAEDTVDGLQQMMSPEHARGFLQRRIGAGLPTSWVHGDQQTIQQLIGDYQLGGVLSFVQGIGNFEVSPENRVARAALQSGDDCFRMFLIQTGLEEAHMLADQLKHNRRKKALDAVEGNSHYYILAVDRYQGQLSCYILDSDPYNNHIKDPELRLRNEFLVSKVLGDEGQQAECHEKFMRSVRQKAKAAAKGMRRRPKRDRR